MYMYEAGFNPIVDSAKVTIQVCRIRLFNVKFKNNLVFVFLAVNLR